jgi:hypothetical protein
MPKHDLAWHTQDMADEIGELEEAKGLIHRWSEVSDVVYAYTRARWSGHKDIKFSLGKRSFYLGLLYMFPKYTLRWKFFRVLGKRFDRSLKISEVRNPQKVEKLENIAHKYNLDPVKFKDEARKLMKRWIFLK